MVRYLVTGWDEELVSFDEERSSRLIVLHVGVGRSPYELIIFRAPFHEPVVSNFRSLTSYCLDKTVSGISHPLAGVSENGIRSDSTALPEHI
jgi:hypothetical protein